MDIKELRKVTGLSQSQFANKYRLSVKQVQSWEQGRRNPPKSIIYMLSRLVSYDFDSSTNK